MNVWFTKLENVVAHDNFCLKKKPQEAQQTGGIFSMQNDH